MIRVRDGENDQSIAESKYLFFCFFFWIQVKKIYIDLLRLTWKSCHMEGTDIRFVWKTDISCKGGWVSVQPTQKNPSANLGFSQDGNLKLLDHRESWVVKEMIMTMMAIG